MSDDSSPQNAGTEGPEGTPSAHEEPPRRDTVCPFCAVGCSIAPGETLDDRAEGVAGPVNSEGRLCPRGIGAFDTATSDDRLRTPLVRRDGELVPVSWETALDRAVTGLREVRAEHGPDAMCFLGAPHSTNEANYLLQKLARTLGTNNVDNRARLCHASAMNALEKRLGRPAMTNSLDDLVQADVFLVVGANPAKQQPVAFNSAVRPAVKEGATLVHVDPRSNRTTRSADVHLAPRPGTDTLLVNLLCALVMEQDLVDDSFIAERTTGYEAFADALEDLDVEAGAALAGVDAERLARVARLFGEADRGAVLAATGIEGSDPSDTDTADALLNLLLLTGNLGRPGTGMNVFRGVHNEQGATDAGCRPDRLPGHQPVTDDETRQRVAEAWGIEPPASPGLNEHQAVERFGQEVHGALVVGENPAVEKRDTSWTHDRLAALETLVAVDIFGSETVEFADVVLPAASGVEAGGTVTNVDRRVQQRRPVVDPPGEARSDFDVLQSLGRRLVGPDFVYDDWMTAFAEWTSLSPVHEGMTLDAVRDDGIRWPVREAGNAGTDVLYTDAFETADGRAAFVTVESDVPDVGTDGLALVVGSRAGGFAADESTDRRLHLNPADAAALDVEDGDAVAVENDAATVRTTATVDDGVREGTVYLHADAADPLVRDDDSTVTVRPV